MDLRRGAVGGAGHQVRRRGVSAALRLALGAALLLAAGAACAQKAAEQPPAELSLPPEAGSAEQASGAPGSAARAAGDAAAPAPVARKLVKTVDLVLRVRDTRASAERLRRLAGDLGGYLAAMSAERRADDLVHYQLTLRVPVERLDEAIAAVEREAERVDHQNLRSEDVTERWVDLGARLRTLRATEAELLGLLAESRQRGQKVQDIMAVYQQLTEIRSTIEQIQGQLQALETLAALSTLNVQLVPTEAAKPILDESWRPGETARRAGRSLVRALQGLADFAIVLLVVGLPLLVVVALPGWLVVAVVRRWRRRRRAAP